MKLTTNLHCDSCNTGIVAMTVTKTKRGKSISMSVDVKGCNVCGKYFGIKGVQGLREVQPTDINVGQSTPILTP